MFPGGTADKLGNRYEAKWLVRQFLDVILGEADAVHFEGLAPEFEGFEFSLLHNGITEWHQTKVNAPSGNWTIGALDTAKVLSAFKKRISQSTDDICVLVSQDGAKALKAMSEKARGSLGVQEFLDNLSDDEKNRHFKKLKDCWKSNDSDSYSYLKRVFVLVMPESEISGTNKTLSKLVFASSSGSKFAELRDYLESNLNRPITTDIARNEMVGIGLALKDWSLDPTLTQTLQAETDAYLASFAPFGSEGSSIARRETQALIDKLTSESEEGVTLLSGSAGSGKSGVVRELIGCLRQKQIPHLAFRVDHHLTAKTGGELGKALTARDESPVTTLKGLFPHGNSILIIDQVDAVSEISGRNGAVREVIFRMIVDARRFGGVRILLVCRSFDFENDPRLKDALIDPGKGGAGPVSKIEVPLLNIENDVEPFLEERSVDLTRLTQKQKELLRLPLNLVLFLETKGTNFGNRDDLFRALLKKKERDVLQKNPSVSWVVSEPLKTMARWMSEKRQLSVPDAVLDEFVRSRDILQSEGLIVSHGGVASFFHESFFDFIYARNFVSGGQSLITFLKGTEQHLFRRTQVRQILEALRLAEEERYCQELAGILSNSGIRFHIKDAIAKWLGSLEDPTQKEFEIVRSLDDGTVPPSVTVSHALLGRASWLDLLQANGWLLDTINSKNPKRSDQVFWWLSRVAEERGSQISSILENWWAGDPARGDRLLQWFGLISRRAADKEIVELCLKLVRSKPPALFSSNVNYRDEMLLSNMCIEFPNGCADVLHALFDAWFDLHPQEIPFLQDHGKSLDTHSLGELATKAPVVFLQGIIEALSRSVDISNAHKAKEGYDIHFSIRSYSGHRFGTDNIVGLVRTALQNVAKDSPQQANDFLAQLDARKSDTLLHLHLETIRENPEWFAGHFCSLLDCTELFVAGWDGAEWKSFADAVKAVWPFLSGGQRVDVEATILQHNPEIESARKTAAKVKVDGEDERSWQTRKHCIYRLNRSGFEQFCVLETIGMELLGSDSSQRLIHLRRKFPDEKLPKPRHNDVYIVGPPIESSVSEIMDDEAWLKAIAKYNNDDRTNIGRDFSRGGASEQAHQLERMTKEDPVRFARLLLRTPDDAHPSYVNAVLRGLLNAKEVCCDLLADCIRRAHGRDAEKHGAEVCHLIGSRPDVAGKNGIFEILVWYVETGEANDEPEIDTANTEAEISSIEDLMTGGRSIHVRGINGARGTAAETLASLLWLDDAWVTKVAAILEKQVETEPLVSVRCCLITALLPLLNHRKEETVKLLLSLTQPPGTGGKIWKMYDAASLFAKRASYRIGWHPDIGPEGIAEFSAPLKTNTGVRLLSFVLDWEVEGGRGILDRLLFSGDESLRQYAAWHIFRKSFHQKAYVKEADRLLREGVIYRRLASSVASDGYQYADLRDRSSRVLIQSFDDDDKAVRSQAAEVFRDLESSDLNMCSDLVSAYTRSKACDDSSWSFYRALETAQCSVTEWAIEAAERMLEKRVEEENLDTGHDRNITEIQTLIRKEYAQSESSSALRTRILDIIDRFLELDLYGAKDIVEAHER